METTDPATGRPLPADAIQRILFLAPSAHVYNIPPLTSNKGYMAAGWTDRQIFTARLRVLETAWETAAPPAPTPVGATGSAVIPVAPGAPAGLAAKENHIKVDIVLEDPSSGQLFAAAPYTSISVVEPVLDSSRFFAVRVQDAQGGSGRRAVLGVGFEERGEAFDFGVALQEAQKSLGLLDATQARKAAENSKRAEEERKKDYSLKEGETITINFAGSKLGRRRGPSLSQPNSNPGAGLQAFSLPPPPGASTSTTTNNNGGGGLSFLPPPPSASSVREQKREKRRSAQDLGFDDGKFGEFA